jgi:biopolymer transport protein ExbD
MNFRRRATPAVFGFQIAPMVDILLVLLVFFIVTWNLSVNEKELDIKIPSASNAKDSQGMIGQVIVNVKADGSLVFNHQPIQAGDLLSKLGALSKLYPDQAVILWGDQNASYKSIVNVLNLCRQADIWNVAFATAKEAH